MWQSQTELHELLQKLLLGQEKIMATLATLQAAITQEGTDIVALQTAVTALGGFITGQLTTDINTIIAALQNSGGNPTLIAQLQQLVQSGDAAVESVAGTVTSTQTAATADDTAITGATGGNPSAPATQKAGS
jgi:hypothetical protein